MIFHTNGMLEKNKFSCHNPLGTRIRHHVKNRKNCKKQENDDNKYHKNSNNNSILYSYIVEQASELINRLCIKLQRITQGGTYLSRTTPRFTENHPGAPEICQWHQIFSQIHWARTKPYHARTELFPSENSQINNNFLLFVTQPQTNNLIQNEKQKPFE